MHSGFSRAVSAADVWVEGLDDMPDGISAAWTCRKIRPLVLPFRIHNTTRCARSQFLQREGLRLLRLGYGKVERRSSMALAAKLSREFIEVSRLIFRDEYTRGPPRSGESDIARSIAPVMGMQKIHFV